MAVAAGSLLASTQGFPAGCLLRHNGADTP